MRPQELSLRVAKPADVWMHVRDSPGAHVVLQLSQAHTHAVCMQCVCSACAVRAQCVYTHYTVDVFCTHTTL